MMEEGQWMEEDRQGKDYVGVSLVYFCHDGNGNFLMQKRGQNCKDEKGKWDIGARGLYRGQSIADTLAYEVRQEYKTFIYNSNFLGYREVYGTEDEEPTHWIALDYTVFVNRKLAANGKPGEIDEIGWFTFENLPDPMHSQLEDFFWIYREKLVRKRF